MPNTLSDLMDNLLSFAGKVGWAILISVVVLWVMGRLRNRIRRVVVKRGGDENIVTIIDNLVRIIVYMILGLVIIGAVTGSSASTVTAIGLITAAISLSLQDVLRNFVSGLYLLIERPFVVGDTIRVSDQRGEVERVDIRTTVIRNQLKEQVFVPNFLVFSQVVRRRSVNESHKYTVKSPYPVHESFDAIWNAALSVQSLPDLPPTVRITGADAEQIDFEVLLWDPADTVRSDKFIAAVKSGLEKATVQLVQE
jgi:small-conductance mechanosensitive channel